EQQGVGAGRDADAVTRLHVGRHLALERRHLLAEHERLALEDRVDRGAELVAQRLVLRAQVEQRDGGRRGAHLRASPGPACTSAAASRSISVRKRAAEKRSAWARIAFASKNGSAVSKRTSARTSDSGVCS